MLEIEMEFRKGLLFLRPTGALNEVTCLEFKTKITNFLYEKGVKYFVINLENIEMIDDKGWSLLEEMSYHLQLQNGKMMICGYQPKFPLDSIPTTFFFNIDYAVNELAAFQVIHV